MSEEKQENKLTIFGKIKQFVIALFNVFFQEEVTLADDLRKVKDDNKTEK